MSKKGSWIWIALAAAVGLAIVGLLAIAALWPGPQPVPSNQTCPSCNLKVIRILYGQLVSDAHDSPYRDKTLPGGQKVRIHSGGGKEFAEGGCLVDWDSPFWFCEGCGRTWGLSLDELAKSHIRKPPLHQVVWRRLARWFGLG